MTSDLSVNPDYSQFTQAYSNAAYVATSAIQLRLDTDPVIKGFEMYLRGRSVRYFEDDNGQTCEQVLWQGKPVVNEVGYQAIMQFIHLTVNNQVVQGNFVDDDAYTAHLCRTRKDLACDLMVNRQRYGLAKEDYNAIMSRIMRMLELFNTRQLHNKERDSYAQTFRSQESLQSGGQSKSWFSVPFGGGKR